MYKVKFTFPYPAWDLIRQTPNSSGIWGDYKFYINESVEECDYWVVFNHLLSNEEKTICSPKNTIFLTAEASSIQSYDSDFMNQFEYVITCQRNIVHKNITYFHQGHPWHVGGKLPSHNGTSFSKSYSELISLKPPKKKRKISIIASNLQLTEGHTKRYEFAKALKNHFKDDIDWFGRGINEVSDKWDALIDYKYSIAIENFQEPDWITEKLYDCYLAYTIPIYHGSPNIEEYFPRNSMVIIDINDLQFSIKQIEAILQNDSHYDQNLEAVTEARLKYLNELNIFPLITNFITKNEISPTNKKKSIILKNKVDTKPNQISSSKFSSIKQKLKSLKSTDETNLSLMSTLMSKTMNWAGRKIIGLSEKLGSDNHKPIPETVPEVTPETSIQAIRFVPWFRYNGDKTLRLDYDLNANSVVFDLGGYEGQWAADIFIKYNCNLFIFEPYELYSENIKNRFSHNDKVTVFSFGLANEDKTLELSLSADSSSLFKKGEKVVEVSLKKASDFFEMYKIGTIDLMKINIEGGEYDLLDHLIESGFIKNIRNIQVQFHDFVTDAETRMKRIQKELSKTHFTTYQYEFVWENWKLK